MKKTIRIFLALVSLLIYTDTVSSQTANAASNEPVKVDVCSLFADPGAYDHKLVQVTGFFSRGFEDSNLYQPTCVGEKATFGIWVEIGGKGGSGVIYCCGTSPYTTRPKDLIVEKMSIPMIDDDQYKKFTDTLTDRSGGLAFATAVGRFFSGKKNTYPRGTFWGGYGHMGCCSLFVLQQVISVGSRDTPGVDYSHRSEWPDPEKEGCNNYTILESDSVSTQLQRQGQVDIGNETWRISNPEKIAKEKLLELVKSPQTAVIQLESVRSSDSRRSYYWRPNGKKGARYFLSIARPYWLSLSAKDPQNTIWVVESAYSVCDGTPQRIFTLTKTKKKTKVR